MITVGVKDKAWLYITDGTVIYNVSKDISKSVWDIHVTKLDMTMEAFLTQCKQQGIKLRKQRGFVFRAVEFTALILYFGCTGAVLLGSYGAMVGAFIGYIFGHTALGFNTKLENKFDQVSGVYASQLEWEALKRQQNKANELLSTKEAEDSCNPYR